MFPTSSFFMGFNCPFYLSGLCERPYCHYRHGPPTHAGLPASNVSSAPSRPENWPRHRRVSDVPARPDAATEYNPTPQPVIEQMRASGMLPSAAAVLQTSDRWPSHATPSAQAAPAAPAAESRPQKRPSAEAAATGSAPAPATTPIPAPAKVARVEEGRPEVQALTPFAYLKNIIEGKSVTQPVVFTADSPGDCHSDNSNSPVKSRLLPPVEIDYGPNFPTHVDNGAAGGGESDDDDDDESGCREKGKEEINEMIRKGLEKLKDLQKQELKDLDPESLKKLNRHLRPLISSKGDGGENPEEEEEEEGKRKEEEEERKKAEEEEERRNKEEEERKRKEEEEKKRKEEEERRRKEEEERKRKEDEERKRKEEEERKRKEEEERKRKEDEEKKRKEEEEKKRKEEEERKREVEDKKEKKKKKEEDLRKKEEEKRKEEKRKEAERKEADRRKEEEKKKRKEAERKKKEEEEGKRESGVKTASQASPGKAPRDISSAFASHSTAAADFSLNASFHSDDSDAAPIVIDSSGDEAEAAAAPQQRQPAPAPSSAQEKGDNIFTRLSRLSSLSALADGGDEYVPTFLDPSRRLEVDGGAPAEYEPSVGRARRGAEEYVPQFTSARAAEAAPAAEYEPAEVCDLTRPVRDAQRLALPSSSDEETPRAAPKVTRSRGFIREKMRARVEEQEEQEEEEEEARKKKKKKKKRRTDSESSDFVTIKKKKKKEKKQKKERRRADEQQQQQRPPPPGANKEAILRSLFGDVDDDDVGGPQPEQPSCSGSADRPGPSAARPDEGQSYFDPLRQRWFRPDGSEDRARAPAAAAAPAPAVPQAERKRSLFQLSAREAMQQRIRWNEQLKLEAAQRAGKSAKPGPAKDPAKEAAKEAAPPADPQKPSLPLESDSSVPIEVRKRYLDLVIQDCLAIYDVPADAYQRALHEEQAASQRCPNRNVYLSRVIAARKKLRREAAGGAGSGAGPPERATVSHRALLGGAQAARGNFGVGLGGGQRSCEALMDELLAGDGFYDRLVPYCLSEEQLVENGYPIAVGGGEVDILGAEEKMKRSLTKIGNERICARCGATFTVDEDGEIVSPAECFYHWGKLWSRRVTGQGFGQRYTCCSADTSVQGCQLAPVHVHEANRYSDLSRYKKAPAADSSRGRHSAPKGVFALDCEMVYTTRGCELARVSVVDRFGAEVFESLVQPQGRVVDCNSRFSGIQPADLAAPDLPDLHQVHKALRRLFNADTILMGHSLESDLIALKLCHEKVVDTSVVFPHRQGAPYKRALKTLALEFLEKIIQADVNGHDSKEDAVVCMELMKMRVMEDLKKSRRTSGSST